VFNLLFTLFIIHIFQHLTLKALATNNVEFAPKAEMNIGNVSNFFQEYIERTISNGLPFDKVIFYLLFFFRFFCIWQITRILIIFFLFIIQNSFEVVILIFFFFFLLISFNNLNFLKIMVVALPFFMIFPMFFLLYWYFE